MLDCFCARTRVLIATWIGVRPRVLERLLRKDTPR